MSLNSSEAGWGQQQLSPAPIAAAGPRSRPVRPENPMAVRSRPNQLVPSRPCRPRMTNPSSTAAAVAAAPAHGRMRQWPAGNRELLRRALSPPLRLRCPLGLRRWSFRPMPSRLCQMSLD
ncbi:uncharacterized protein LOC109715278 [Ananas comosus]|uniref:Uncharacterized protein LOC109715278 n=1 Tax=Ananas comosus TaxID=4615 RepID=A0A6P5FHK6_ANACO|nr:uncharacterized protein LOC109715278 [Ananas comosus]